MLVLLGFVFGSLVRVWPWYDGEAVEAAQLLRTGSASPLDLQIPGAVIWCAVGIAAVVLFELLGSRKKSA